MKFLIYTGLTLGSIAGAYVPSLWHAGEFSAWGIFGGFVGAFAGIYGGYKLGKYLDLE